MRPRSRATDPLPCRFPQHLSGPAGSVGAQDREVPHRVGGQVMKTWATHDTQGRRHGREDAVAPEILRLGGRLVQGAARRCRLPPRPTWSPTDQIPAAPGSSVMSCHPAQGRHELLALRSPAAHQALPPGEERPPQGLLAGNGTPAPQRLGTCWHKEGARAPCWGVRWPLPLGVCCLSAHLRSACRAGGR